MKNLFLLGLVFNLSLAFAGSESGGGGGTVLIKSKPILVDYFTIIKDAKELPVLGKKASRVSQAETPFTQENEAAKALKKILRRWENEASDPVATQIRKTFIRDVSFVFVKEKQHVPDFYLAPIIRDKKVYVAASHDYALFAVGMVRINLDIWNKMDLTNQVGLLLHESLRHSQNGMLGGYTDITLQSLTAMYMLCKPNETLSQVANIYYNEKFAQYESKKLWAYNFDSFIQSDCKRN